VRFDARSPVSSLIVTAGREEPSATMTILDVGERGEAPLMSGCNTILLTGVPRSGTTLVCHLLNKLPDTVALNEPRLDLQSVIDWQNQGALCSEIGQFLEHARRSLIEDGIALSRQVDGQIPDNPAEDRVYSLFRLLLDRSLGHRVGKYTRLGLRRINAFQGVITIEKPLSNDFLLRVKHNPIFTAILESLHQSYPCYAIVRNPLSVLASWNSIGHPCWEGRSPTVESLDHALAQKLARTGERFERQICLLSWWFEKYLETLPGGNILRYEDIVASGGAALKVITTRALELDETLENRNLNELYDRELMGTLGEKLLTMDGPFGELYSRESVELLVDDFCV
jgi:hypothetical protein